MFVVETQLMEALFKSPEWKAKLKKAKTSEQFMKVLADFAKAKGFRVKHGDLGKKKNARANI